MTTLDTLRLRKAEIERLATFHGARDVRVFGSVARGEDTAASDIDFTEADQQHLEVSPSGYGIHWPTIDEDISIDGLLGIAHGLDTRRKSA